MATLELYCQIIDGKLIASKSKIVEFAATAPNGCYSLTIKRDYKPKSQKQLGNIFGNMIRKVVNYCNDNDHIIDTSEFLRLLFDDSQPSGVGVTADFVKSCLYRACPQLDDHDKPITLSDMNTVQANRFFEESAALLSSRFLPIEDPKKDWCKEQVKKMFAEEV